MLGSCRCYLDINLCPLAHKFTTTPLPHSLVLSYPLLPLQVSVGVWLHGCTCVGLCAGVYNNHIQQQHTTTTYNNHIQEQMLSNYRAVLGMGMVVPLQVGRLEANYCLPLRVMPDLGDRLARWQLALSFES
mmetsp:Transcript_51780/g.75785  ORF Transcript_51780/g.75785 Transcript_51780/m.75785 type:complete len:131 (+) Transcript_51780:132-524(+)